MEQNDTLDALMRSYHPEDHPDNESALRAILHIVAGVALDLQRGCTLTKAQRADLEQIAGDDALWPETKRVVRQIANGHRNDADKSCLACGATDCSFEKHHYPVPAIVGGENTILLCRTCHNLVSRVPLRRWPWEVYEKVLASGLSGPSLLAFLNVVEAFWRKDAESDFYDPN